MDIPEFVIDAYVALARAKVIKLDCAKAALVDRGFVQEDMMRKPHDVTWKPKGVFIPDNDGTLF